MWHLDPFVNCPVYETESFMLRKLMIEDSEELFECYSDPVAAQFFNGDNCGDDFYYTDFEKFKKCINYWIHSYTIHDFVRWSIVHKQTNKCVGTVELCPSHKYSKAQETIGILRIDLLSSLETTDAMEELFAIFINHFYRDFQLDFLLTKAVPQAAVRLAVLNKHSFIDAAPMCTIPFAHYFIK